MKFFGAVSFFVIFCFIGSFYANVDALSQETHTSNSKGIGKSMDTVNTPTEKSKDVVNSSTEMSKNAINSVTGLGKDMVNNENMDQMQGMMNNLKLMSMMSSMSQNRVARQITTKCAGSDICAMPLKGRPHGQMSTESSI